MQDFAYSIRKSAVMYIKDFHYRQNLVAVSLVFTFGGVFQTLPLPPFG